eukprot:NODE_5387_length_512_cov_119.043197_g4005_i0.p5 GENE.NODE_5387_length_512_cov_119.043197_g4005_i0~~NODE_5387_length_512_cov_119.043197_g4005_i0.p5  ORF type:complete len:59 (-),score=28.52 NODE_5387_length_512_cov_119.043197_g4005_i0:336-482(-)
MGTAFWEGERKVFCFGGWDGTQYLNSLWEYEFAEPIEKEKVGRKKRGE